ncbi:hypothetical protein V6N11_040183 [Hibiscus sabdariffa]|uniref:Uncharacterized protein n=1 Tax=Hibiscus sabdariffa TaxID=183260 RepID=A0ABR2RH51_9ROSI
MLMSGLCLTRGARDLDILQLCLDRPTALKRPEMKKRMVKAAIQDANTSGFMDYACVGNSNTSGLDVKTGRN